MSTTTPPTLPPPESDREVDRAAILARRAMFITTALAAFGCAPPGGSAEPPTRDGRPAVSTTPESVDAPKPTPPAPRSFADLERLAPPRSVSDKLTGEEKAALEAAARELAPAYERLARAYEATPIACSPDDPKCEPTWAQVVDDLRVVREAIGGPRCGARGKLAGEIQRYAAHERFLGEQADAIEAELAAAAKRWRAEGKWAGWTAVISPPQPCLRCALPEPRVVTPRFDYRVVLAIGFAEGDSSSPDGDALAELKATLDAEPTLKVVLRGHADPSEADADALALARAKAVQSQLVAQGVSAGRLKVKSYGAELPVGPVAVPEGRALNRRVDVDRVK